MELQTPEILGVGTATPYTSYSQEEILDLLEIEDRRTRLLFSNSGIDNRYLTLPEKNRALPASTLESQGTLLNKHKSQSLDVGTRALESCLENIEYDIKDIKGLVCVTSTGMLTPSLTALLSQRLGLRNNCYRLDVVGMGCNAGLNGLNATARWAQANPGELAVVLCVEMCSAAYVIDNSTATSVVNSLFGDGAAALAVIAGNNLNLAKNLPKILSFSSCIIPEAMDAMRFDWDERHGKFSFYLSRDVPYVIGAHVGTVVKELLDKSGKRKSDVAHWIVHSGGKKVIDSIKVNLGLTATDLRHTTGILRDYGNVSSGSFIFSFERLIEEGIVEHGDLGVMITMGPGATIESALLQF